jgi:hypothetical protein
VASKRTRVASKKVQSGKQKGSKWQVKRTKVASKKVQSGKQKGPKWQAKRSKVASFRGRCRRADVAEAALVEVGAALLKASDPAPILERMGEASRALAALQRQNRKLELDAKAAESEASAAIGMAARLQELEDSNAQLRRDLAAEVGSLCLALGFAWL